MAIEIPLKKKYTRTGVAKSTPYKGRAGNTHQKRERLRNRPMPKGGRV